MKILVVMNESYPDTNLDILNKKISIISLSDHSYPKVVLVLKAVKL